MYAGNVILVILNLPLIALWVQVLKVPYAYLFPMILLFCLIGAFSMNNMIGDVGIMVVFGGLGYLFRYFGYEAPPLILALVLGPIMEDTLRQSLTIAGGSFAIFFQRPISAIFLIATFLIMGSKLLSHIYRKK
jgi:putative tricarboxylic transport membrane protein